MLKRILILFGCLSCCLLAVGDKNERVVRLTEAARIASLSEELHKEAWQLVKSGNEQEQFWAFAALVRSGEKNPEMHKLVLQLLNSGKRIKDSDGVEANGGVQLIFRPSLRGMAAWSVGYLGLNDPKIMLALRDILYGENEVLRSQAATSLKILGGKGIEYLEEVVEKGNMGERLTALSALRADREGLLNERYRAMQRSLFPEILKMTYPDSGDTSLLVNGGFEVKDFSGKIQGWELVQEDGAKGRIEIDNRRARTGKSSVKIIRENSQGNLYLRSTETVKIRKGTAVTLRGYFQSEKSPLNSALLFRFEDEDGRMSVGEPWRGHMFQSQTFLRNTIGGFWDKRIATFKDDSKDRELRVRIYLQGNPTEVWLDDLTFPASAYDYSYSAPVRVISGELDRRLWAQEPSEAATGKITTNILKEEQGSVLEINGEKRAPVLYLSLRMGDNVGMSGVAGVPMVVSRLNVTDHVDNRYPLMFPVWTKGNQYDFTTPLESLRFVSELAPEAGIILNINVLWPEDWVDRHPEDAWINSEGKKGYGSTVHFRGFEEALPEGYRWWPSPYSEKALADASDLIRAFLNEVQKTPYAGRVVGCFVSGGHDGQFYTGVERWADHSPAGVNAFRNWLKQRYKSDEGLQEAWHRADVSLDTVGVPDLSKTIDDPLTRSFLSPLQHQDIADYREFMVGQGMRIRELFARTFKEVMGQDKLGITWQLGGGKGAGSYTVFLPSDVLDIMVPQPAYEMRTPGYYGGISAPLAGYHYHNKLLVKELDLRTWLRAGGAEVYNQRLGAAMTPEWWKNVNRKEVGQMIAGNHGYWYFDIGSTHFRDLDMLEEIRESRRIADEQVLKPRDLFKPDVVVLTSELSQYWGHPLSLGRSGWLRLQSYLYKMLKTSGVPYDEHYFEDVLSDESLQNYKVFIFEDAYRISDKQREVIEAKLKKEGRVLIWVYAPGFVSDIGPSLNAVSELVGMNVETSRNLARTDAYWVDREDPLSKGMHGLQGIGEMYRIMYTQNQGPHNLYDVQQFWIEDSTAQTLASYKNGNTAIAVKRFDDWTSVYVASPAGLEARLLNNIAREAGAHVLTEPGIAVEMNGTFLSVHGMQSGDYVMNLPYEADIVSLDDGQVIARNTKQFSITVKAQQQYWFEIQPIKGDRANRGHSTERSAP